MENINKQKILPNLLDLEMHVLTRPSAIGDIFISGGRLE
jgi:hypothetical protein